MLSVLTITLKDDERTYKQKFLLYEPYIISEDDETIKDCINEALSNAEYEPDEIRININFEI